jgi:hypothetical protein
VWYEIALATLMAAAGIYAFVRAIRPGLDRNQVIRYILLGLLGTSLGGAALIVALAS